MRKFLLPGRPTPTGQLLMTLTCAIKEGFTYTRRSEHGTQDPVVTVRSGRGSCRDFALLMMEAVRSLGLRRPIRVRLSLRAVTRWAARGRGLCRRRLDPRLVPGLSAGRRLGGVRSTNGIIGNRDLIRVAVARDPSQAVPLSGTYAGSPDDELGMKVQVNVEAETQAEDADAAKA